MAKPTTVPIWDSTAINITTPVGEQTYGWGVSQAPPAQVFNWLHHWTYQWVNWLNSVAGMVADAWAWTGRHSFIRAHATESAVQISNTGGGSALVVTGPSTVGSIGASSVTSGYVAATTAGVAGTFTNSNGADTGAALEVYHTGQLALFVGGGVEVVGGAVDVTGDIVSAVGDVVVEAGDVSATAGDISAPLGTVTAQRLVGTGNGDPGTPALNMPIYSNGWPSTISVGDVWLQTSGGNLTLYVQTGTATRYSFTGTLVP